MTEWNDVNCILPKNEQVLILNEVGDMSVGSYEITPDGGAWRIGSDSAVWVYERNTDFKVTYWAHKPDDTPYS